MLALRNIAANAVSASNKLLHEVRLAGFKAAPLAMVQVAGLKNFKPPPVYNVEFPERRKLPIMQKVPQYPPTMRPFKMQKKLKLMRGPELIHNSLIHKQFGIVATGGGRLRSGHFEMMRLTIGRKLDVNRMFAIWRVDAPWQPVTKKGQGQRMGGGKGAIDHYVTPIRAGRVILEVGGTCEYIEIKKVLTDVANKLPFSAIAVDENEMQKMKQKESRIENENLNPWTFKYFVQNDLQGCHTWISPVDKIWFGKYN